MTFRTGVVTIRRGRLGWIWKLKKQLESTLKWPFRVKWQSHRTYHLCRAAVEFRITQSADYIQLYHGNASLLAESLEVIQQTSAVILAALESSATETMADAELAKVA